MKASDYEGEVEAWKIELAIQRARRVGFRRHDLEDAVQELAMTITGFVYDATKAGGLSEQQALCGLIDRRLIDMLRARRRHAKASDPTPMEECGDPDAVDQDLNLDVNAALQKLSRVDRDICKCLSLGQAQLEIAENLDLSSWDVRTRVEGLRTQFRDAGLEGYLPEPRNGSAGASFGAGPSDNLRNHATQSVNQFDCGVDPETNAATEDDVVRRAWPA